MREEKIGSKYRQKSAYSSVFFSSQLSSLPSLSTVSSAPEDPHIHLYPSQTDVSSASPQIQILTSDRGSHCEVFPLPSADFLPLQISSSYAVATPPTKLPSTPPPASRQPPRPAAPPTRVRWRPLLLPRSCPILVAIACRIYSACNDKTINFEGGQALIRPNPHLWVGSSPPQNTCRAEIGSIILGL